MHTSSSSRVLRLAAALSVIGSMPAAAQQATVRSPAAALSSPGGAAIGSVRAGAVLRVIETRGRWARVTIDGYVEASRVTAQRGTASPRVGRRSATVRTSASANARSMASLDAGTIVAIPARARGGWVRVTRRAWVLGSALERESPASAAGRRAARAPASRGEAGPSRAPRESAGEVARTETARPVGTSGLRDSQRVATVAAGAALPAANDSVLVPVANTLLRAAPGARPLANLAPGTELIPLARDRGWVRVRIEGWVPEREVAPPGASAPTAVSAADLRADPQGTRGRVVRWNVQILARQSADPLRRDLAPHETYFLARGPDEENALLYLVIPPSLAERTKAIHALSPALITARVRTGKSELVGVPILELMTITQQKE